MAFTNLSTRSTGYLVTATNWNEMVNNWLAVATSAGLLKHEYGGLEVDVSAITTGGIFRGASSGVVSILADFLDGSGRVKHEMGGIEADISSIAAGGLLKGSGTGSMGILARGSASQILRVNSGGSDLEFASVVSPSLVVKDSNQSYTSTAGLQNDSELVIALAANTEYAIMMFLSITSSANADYKYSFTTPTSPTTTGYRSHIYFPANESAANEAWLQTQPDAHQVITTTEELTVYDTDPHGLVMFGSIRNGSNAGNLQLQHAQGTSHGDTTQTNAGSWLLAIPVV